MSKILHLLCPLMSPPLATWNQPPCSFSSFSGISPRPRTQSCFPSLSTRCDFIKEQQQVNTDDDVSSYLEELCSLPASSPQTLSFGEVLQDPSSSGHSIIPTRNPQPQTACLNVSPEFDSGLSLDASCSGVSAQMVNPSVCCRSAPQTSA